MKQPLASSAFRLVEQLTEKQRSAGTEKVCELQSVVHPPSLQKAVIVNDAEGQTAGVSYVRLLFLAA